MFINSADYIGRDPNDNVNIRQSAESSATSYVHGRFATNRVQAFDLWKKKRIIEADRLK